MEAGLAVLRLILVVVGLWYLSGLVRNRLFSHPTAQGALGPKPLGDRVGRLERIRAQCAMASAVSLIPLTVSTLVRGPLWLTDAFLAVTGLFLTAYLVASVMLGWTEGRVP